MTPERKEENKLKKGDRVVMHTCIEAEEEPGKIWTCKTDQFTRGKGILAQDSVFLEGYSGSFAPEFLQKVMLPTEDEGLLAALEEAQQKVKDLKEDKRKIFAIHDEQCARSSEYYNELIFVKGKLREEEQEKTKYKAEAERLNEICRQLAGEEMMFQEGQYETEMQSLENRLAEAQQTIARQQDHMKLKDEAVEFWMELGGRLADACEYYADEHWDNGTMAEDALSYYLPAVGRKRA